MGQVLTGCCQRYRLQRQQHRCSHTYLAILSPILSLAGFVLLLRRLSPVHGRFLLLLLLAAVAVAFCCLTAVSIGITVTIVALFTFAFVSGRRRKRGEATGDEFAAVSSRVFRRRLGSACS